MPEREALEYAVQIAQGLAAAHERGIVHRDLKPENLFLTRDRRMKILDFGVAKIAPGGRGPRGRDRAITDVGIVVGTVGYMAPEQVRGEPIDHRADIFALGVVIHEMLSGSGLPARHSGGNADRDPQGRFSRSIGGCAPALQRVLRRCLEKPPDDRFHSAHDLGLAFELMSALTAIAPPSPRTGRPRMCRAAPRSSMGPRRSPCWRPDSAEGCWPSVSARGGRAFVPPADIQTRADPIGTLCARRPDDLLQRALGRRTMPRAPVRMDSPESDPLDLPDANLLAISRSGEVALALGSHVHGIVTYGTLANVPMAGGVLANARGREVRRLVA